MYRITYDIVKYLVSNTNPAAIPGIDEDENKPFIAKNIHAIGFIDPVGIIGSSFDYLIECDFPIQKMMDTPYVPSVDGLWLYRKDELKIPNDPVQVPKGLIAPTVQNPAELFDITDCCIVLPSAVDKLICMRIDTIEKLLEKEPQLKNCLLWHPVKTKKNFLRIFDIFKKKGGSRGT